MLTKHINFPASTWKRGDKEGIQDLVFASYLPTFIPSALNSSRIGPDHDLVADTMTTVVLKIHTYSTLDWTWWEEYAEENPPSTPTNINDAYTHQTQLLYLHAATKTTTPRSKNWWDQEL